MTQERASFLSTAEQMVEARPEVAATAEQEPTLEESRADTIDRLSGHRYDPEYEAMNRAKVLLSMEVTREYSPSERLTLKVPKGHPYEYRWNEDRHRHRVGMGPWEPLTGEIGLKEAHKICPTKTVRLAEDGRIMAGELFLCKAPREEIEKLRALHYQRSQRKLRAASKGSEASSIRNPDGTISPASETFDQLHRSTARPGDKGIRFTGKLTDG